MAGELQNITTASDALRIAIGGAAAGGGFALFNTLVSKGLDALATKIGNSRQVRGMVVAAVLEVAKNIDALLRLVAILEFTSAQLQQEPTNETTAHKAQCYIQHKLRHNCVCDAMWEHLAKCEAVGEHGVLALMLLPDRYDAAHALFVETESLCEHEIILVPEIVDDLSKRVRDELRASAHAAVLLLASYAGSKVASSAWVLFVHRLARLQQINIPALTGINRSAEVRKLQRSVRRVANEKESADVYHNAMLFLGTADSPNIT